jgi:hypothetical protein
MSAEQREALEAGLRQAAFPPESDISEQRRLLRELTAGQPRPGPGGHRPARQLRHRQGADAPAAELHRGGDARDDGVSGRGGGHTIRLRAAQGARGRPAEVEAVLYNHPAITEVAVVGTPHEQWGEAVTAVVALKPGAGLTLEELRAFARDKLARYKIPLRLELVDALPRNPAGKVLKYQLRERITTPSEG